MQRIAGATVTGAKVFTQSVAGTLALLGSVDLGLRAVESFKNFPKYTQHENLSGVLKQILA